MRKSLFSACSSFAFVAAVLYGPVAHAQSMDYGALQTLYGEPITTSATGTPQKVSDVAANMTIITADQIRQSGSRDIPQILSRVPGLDILQSSSVSFDVGVRGYQQPMQPRLLVLIDGRQVFQDDYSRTVWNNLPVNIDDIRQIEVVKGASSALFGSNAAGGVVNIITYSPLYDGNNVGSISFGTQSTVTTDATVSQKIGSDAGIKLSAGGMNANEFTTPRVTAGTTSELPLTVNPRHRYVASNSVFQIAPEVQGTAEATYSSSRSTLGYFTGRLGELEDAVYSVRGGLTWESPIGTIKSNNYLNHTHTNNWETGQNFNYYTDTEDLIVSQLEDQFRIGQDHTIRISGEYRNTTFKLDGNQATPQSPSIEENNFAFGGMWYWQILDRLSWTNAARLDHFSVQETGTLWSQAAYPASAYDISHDTISANSGLVYKATDVDSLRATYGRGVQMPRLLDYGFIASNTSASTKTTTERVGNPYLAPTIVTEYELGDDHKLDSLFSTVKTSVFYEFNSALMDPLANMSSTFKTSLGTTRLAESINVGNSKGYGGELQLVGGHSGFRWDTSYSYAIVSNAPGANAPAGINAPVPAGYESSTPKHHVRLLLGYTTGPWEFDVNGNYLTSSLTRRSVNPYTQDYSAVSARVGYQINQNFTVAASGTNLTQAATYSSAFPAVERQALLTLTVKY